MTTTTTPHPDIPLPAGAISVDYDPRDSSYRIIFGSTRTVTDCDAKVWSAAIQFGDGSIDDGSRGEAPTIYVRGASDGINSDQARELAAALLEAAAEVDGWGRVMTTNMVGDPVSVVRRPHGRHAVNERPSDTRQKDGAVMATTTCTPGPLAGLRDCETHLLEARSAALNAAHWLPPGSRRNRATELAEKVTETLAFCERLQMVVDGDLRGGDPMSTGVPLHGIELPPGVSIDVEQSSRRIILWGHDTGDELDSGQTRQLAAALVAVADELDGRAAK